MSFIFFSRSSEQDTKKWGMLTLVNQMFKVYFKTNRHHLCKPLIRAIDSCILKDRFSLAQTITYKFYAGRRAMFDGDFSNADECLSYAFQRCHKRSPKNKRSILLYLVPIKMNLVSIGNAQNYKTNIMLIQCLLLGLLAKKVFVGKISTFRILGSC